MKRVNIIQTLNKEFNNGKEYIDSEGYTISTERLEDDLERKFLKDFKEGKISRSITFDEYLKQGMATYKKISEVVKVLEDFGIKYTEKESEGNEKTTK